MQMFGVPRGWILWVWWASDLSSSLILLWNDCYQLSHVFHVLREMHPINFDDLPILSTGANLKLTAWFFPSEIFFVIRQNNPPSCVFMVLAGWLTRTLSQILTQNDCLKKLSSHLICRHIIVLLYRLSAARLHSLKEYSEAFCIVFAKLYFQKKKKSIHLRNTKQILPHTSEYHRVANIRTKEVPVDPRCSCDMLYHAKLMKKMLSPLLRGQDHVM